MGLHVDTNLHMSLSTTSSPVLQLSILAVTVTC